MTFPNPCPVCGATDEHAAWAATVVGSPATFCPHPGEPGHGTGCCCAGRSTSPFGVAKPDEAAAGALRERTMTDLERIAVRHLLQEAMERCRVLRDAMDPRHGVLVVRAGAFAVDVERIVGPLVRAEQQAIRGWVQRNALP